MAVIAPDVSLEEYLRGHGIDIKRAAGSEVVVPCFMGCGETRNSKRKLYLNTDTWLWDCKVCGDRGGKRRLLEHFGDTQNEESPNARDPHVRSRVLDEYATVTEDLLVNNEAMLSYLFGRGLTPQTIEAARLGYVPRGRMVSEDLPSALKPGGFRRQDLEESGMVSVRGGEFLAGKITIPYLSGSHVLQIRGKDPAGKYVTPAGDSVRLYNADDLRDAERVIITEGEFDAMLLKQTLALSTDPRLRSIAVVAIPGVGALPGGKEGFPEYFRNAKRVFVLLDADDAGRMASITIKSLLGATARIVELPDEQLLDSHGDVVKLDVTEYLRPKHADHPYGGHTWRDIADLLAQADLVGKRVFSVADATIQWREDAQTGNAISLGFPTLDALMGGGLRVGNLCIPVAKTGTGKSVFLANIAYQAASRDIETLLISLETTAAEVYDILRRVARFHGDPRISESQIADTMPSLRIVQENRLSPEDFSVLIEEYREDVGSKPRLVMVDYLGYYSRGRRGNNQYEKVSDATMQLKAEAKDHRCAIIAPHQVNRGAKDGHPLSAEEARDSGVVEETADWMFGLYRPGEAGEHAGNVTSSLNLNVLKGRRGGKGRVIRLGMSNLSLAIVDYHDRKAMARIDLENQEYNRGTKYDDWLRDQRAIRNGQEQMRLVT